MSVIVIVIAAHPKPQHTDYGRTDGAHAACWVSTDSPAEAERRARTHLDEAGWFTEEAEEPQLVTRDAYDEDPAGLERFDAAAENGIAIVLHTWPVGAPDED